jgi:hypothetical protein
VSVCAKDKHTHSRRSSDEAFDHCDHCRCSHRWCGRSGRAWRRWGRRRLLDRLRNRRRPLTTAVRWFRVNSGRVAFQEEKEEDITSWLCPRHL